MTHEEAFLQDILERPDDDVPRLIFADWLEENGDSDRSAFIRLRIAQARDPAAPARRYVTPSEKLLERNWDRWVAPLARLIGSPGREPHSSMITPRPTVPMKPAVTLFPRGFVSDLAMTAERFISNGDAILRLTPLTALRLHGAGGLGERLAACEPLRWIRELDFTDYFRDPVGATDMASLARSPHLERLTSLRLHRNNLGDDGARALAAAGWLRGVTSLDLTDNGLSTTGLRALTARRELPNLRILRLDGNGFDDEAVSLLLDAPWLGGLEFLSLRNAGGSPGAADELLARSPRLRLNVG